MDIKSFPITHIDFNDISKPISFEFSLSSQEISELLETKVKSKVKKTEGLEEFIQDLVSENTITFKRSAQLAGKSLTEEFILLHDFDKEDCRR